MASPPLNTLSTKPLSEMEALPPATNILPGWKSTAGQQRFKSLSTNHFQSKRFRRGHMT